MGVLAVGVGKGNEALNFFKTALEVKPNIAQYWLSYIDALIKLERIADAKAVLEQAKSTGPRGDGFEKVEERLGLSTETIATENPTFREPPEEELQSLINLYSQGQYQQLHKQTLQLLKKFSNSFNLYNILGTADRALGDLDKAIEAYTKALSIKPDYVEAYYNMGNALQDQLKPEEAIEAYTKALSIKPDFAEAYNNMGNALKEQGKLEKATESYTKALSIKPDYPDAYNNVGVALTGVIFTKPNKDIQKTIVSLLDKERYIRPSDIAGSVISLLKLDPHLKKHLNVLDTGVIESPLDVISDLSGLSLLRKIMSICPLPDLEMEQLFINLRRSILSNISSLQETSAELLSFQSALALQCFITEYIYNFTDEEEKVLRTLESTIKKDFKNNKQPSPQAVLAIASYKALNQYDWCKLLIVTNDIKEVFTRQVEEPNEEEKLKNQFPILEEITDSVSSEVRAQYEESPYPRWVNLGLPLRPRSILNVVDEIKLKLYDNKINEVEKPEILIAGCGTGQHSIETAARFKGSNVLAIDLSLSSLAYAKRKTKELGIENIEYMQADILDLGQLNKQFDIIESSGVLHHIDNPMTGWRVLTDCLKPGGLMKIGLYSELARQHISNTKKEISRIGIGSSSEAMRSFRNIMIKSHEDHHKLVTEFGDFYSLSELKDLLFHVQEHGFTIPKIKEHLDELGLKFCGFEGNVVENFKLIHTQKEDTYDLGKWTEYEEINPRTFAGMYQFWCQKAD
jgi:ubiquinone/menaquinone biosynthesis C-methylase UbiE